MSKTESYNDISEFLQKNRSLIENVCVTHIDVTGFNDMEGNQCTVYIKVETVKGYNNKLIQWYTNDTYLYDFEGEKYTEKVNSISEFLSVL